MKTTDYAALADASKELYASYCHSKGLQVLDELDEASARAWLAVAMKAFEIFGPDKA